MLAKYMHPSKNTLLNHAIFYFVISAAYRLYVSAGKLYLSFSTSLQKENHFLVIYRLLTTLYVSKLKSFYLASLSPQWFVQKSKKETLDNSWIFHYSRCTTGCLLLSCFWEGKNGRYDPLCYKTAASDAID